VVAARGEALGGDRGSALVRRADEEGRGEQPDAELHPALAEVPRVAVADHREPGRQQRQRRGRQRQWPDDPQRADEAPGLLRLAGAQDADRERGQDHQRPSQTIAARTWASTNQL
jgi:hypothetical protein